jgi:hypothetical protein
LGEEEMLWQPRHKNVEGTYVTIMSARTLNMTIIIPTTLDI